MAGTALGAVYQVRDEIATANRQMLSAVGVLAVGVFGPGGCGKSSLIESTMRSLSGLRTAAVMGTMAPPPRRRADDGLRVVEVETACLAAQDIRRALKQMPLDELDLIFIEASGSPAPGAELDLGQDIAVAAFSTCGGNDKPAECPDLVAGASAIVLGKIDLLPHVPFDVDMFREDIRRLNGPAQIMELSVLMQTGLDAWLTWLDRRRISKRWHATEKPIVENSADSYLG